MDEYLSEKEQLERIKEWWRENGWFLIGGAAVVLLGTFGYRQYLAHQDRVGEQAAAVYFELSQAVKDDDREGADRLLEQLVEDYEGSPYLDQARLLVAEDNLIRDTDRAIAELEAVVAESKDEGLVKIARLRLARTLAYDEQYDRALAALDAADLGEFEARYAEVRGDIYAATGDTDAAVNAYTDALIGGGAVNQQLLQLKLEALIESRDADLDQAAGTADGAPSGAGTELEADTDTAAEPAGAGAGAGGDAASGTPTGGGDATGGDDAVGAGGAGVGDGEE